MRKLLDMNSIHQLEKSTDGSYAISMFNLMKDNQTNLISSIALKNFFKKDWMVNHNFILLKLNDIHYNIAFNAKPYNTMY